MNALKQRMAVVLVSHRVQSVRRADRINVLEEGRIADKGRPDELIERDNLFSRSLADFKLA